MYSVWFCDLEKAIKAFHEKFPYWETFNSIKGNADGDFVFRCGADSFIVKHTNFSVWKYEGSWKDDGKWVEVS